MKKHNYRAKKVNDINWSLVKENLAGGAAVLAVDIAKEKQYALLSTMDNSVSELWYWNHPEQTREVLAGLESLRCPLTVVMESTSTYGDAMRYQFRRSGFDVDQISAKRVFDAREIYDGVPSLHDAKSVTVIMRLHREGLSKPWRESNANERNLDALRREFDLHQSQYLRNQNRLEAYLSRHWPEVLSLLSLDSVTLESLLINYGTPERITRQAQEVEQKMRAWGKSQLKDDKIERVLRSAAATLGQPCLDTERHYLQALAEEMRHNRQQCAYAKQALEAIVNADDGLKELRLSIGLVTTAILLSCRLDPRNYANAHSFHKALGLNLKEKSSGRYQGQLKITKRGCSMVRRYLYFAALRLIKNDPVAKAWYQAKVDARFKNKTVIAVMCKLAKALWYLGRGERFDARKLFTVAV
ncbi:MAG: transposase [Methylobacter sp.]|nr:transposase [Methylobacter sp.]